MKNGDKFTSKHCGGFEIINYLNSSNVEVRFTSTGTVVKTQGSHILRGTIRDKMFPVKMGVGYIGYGSYNSNHRAYSRWNSMIHRCYSGKNSAYSGCTVCKDWLNFQCFAEWFEENYIEEYHLDKDIKVKGNKTYSPETCMFVTQEVNSREARNNPKPIDIISPCGNIHTVINQNQFCKEHSLHWSSFNKMLNGIRKTAQNWRLK